MLARFVVIGFCEMLLTEFNVKSNQPRAEYPSSDTVDDVDERALAQAMRVVPLGAGILAGTAVALLVIGYLLIYLLVFIPRGSVG